MTRNTNESYETMGLVGLQSVRVVGFGVLSISVLLGGRGMGFSFSLSRFVRWIGGNTSTSSNEIG